MTAAMMASQRQNARAEAAVTTPPSTAPSRRTASTHRPVNRPLERECVLGVRTTGDVKLSFGGYMADGVKMFMSHYSDVVVHI